MAISVSRFDTTPEQYLPPREELIQEAMIAIPELLQQLPSDSAYDHLLPAKHHRVIGADRLAARLIEEGYQAPAAHWAIHRLVEGGTLRAEINDAHVPFVWVPGDTRPAPRPGKAHSGKGRVPFECFHVFTTDEFWRDWDELHRPRTEAEGPVPLNGMPEEQAHQSALLALAAISHLRAFAKAEAEGLAVIRHSVVRELFHLRRFAHSYGVPEAMEPSFSRGSYHGQAVLLVAGFLSLLRDEIERFRQSDSSPKEGWQRQNDIFVRRFSEGFSFHRVSNSRASHVGADKHGSYVGYVSDVVHHEDPDWWHDDAWPVLAKRIREVPSPGDHKGIIEGMEAELRKVMRRGIAETVEELCELAKSRKEILKRRMDENPRSGLRWTTVWCPPDRDANTMLLPEIEDLWNRMAFFDDTSLLPYPDESHPEPLRTLQALNSVIAWCRVRIPADQATIPTGKIESVNVPRRLIKRRGRPRKSASEREANKKLYRNWKAANELSGISKTAYIAELKRPPSDIKFLERGRKATEADEKSHGDKSN